jgi:hypothetical protein
MSTSLASAEPIPTSTTPSSIPHDIARKYVYFGAAFDSFDLALILLQNCPNCAARPFSALSRLIFSIAHSAPRPSCQLGIIWRPLRPDLYEPGIITSTVHLKPPTDVYCYNFPNDRRIVKCLGKHQRFFYPQNDDVLSLAYFTFLFETAQTVFNGADVYYWFIEGFGDVQRLKNPHLSPMDVPISHSVMSFVVQQYFCFRIWTLDKRLLMLCIIISIVRGRLQVLPFPRPLTRYFASSFQYFNHPCRCGAGLR